MRSRILAVIIFIITSVTSMSSQRWIAIDPAQIASTGQRDIVPSLFSTYEIDTQSILQILSTAPDELILSLNESNTIITVGLADGSMDDFRIVRYQMMEEELSKKFPYIKTCRGISTTNPYRTIRIDWTAVGFRAVISEPGLKTYIDPYQRGDLQHCIAYYRNDYSRSIEWNCGVDVKEKDDDIPARSVGDCLFRSYRLAVAATGEYSNFFGATSSAQSALVLAQVVTAINRVNDVYEADMAVRLILIANTNNIFYYNPATDPYGTSACTQLSQNQTTCDNVIGSANYDVGHVFSVGSGGCAGLGVICLGGQKARGATGLNPPTGDPFYIDYVAHELGHQFGGDHTFNGTAGSCNGNRVGTSAYEPGSGSTIQAYAGICGAQNLQPNSDAYMHARSLLQIANKLTSTSCAAFLSFNNTAPVANSTADYTIPISTPFVLTASATDANNDSLSYCWEQYDLEGTSTEPPTSNDADGPLFRSFNPKPIPSRYFPRLQDLTQNINPMWEILPSVTRVMNFKMTVRDYHNGTAGCTDEDDVVVTANSSAGPFSVTSQNSGATWQEGSNQTVTWNVANTTASPINCSHVDIFLSYDGGLTYPTTVVTNEVNDGSALITVPAGVTNDGRIMVKASNNIFFDINNQDIIIEAGLPNFTISLNPSSVNECNDGSVSTTVNIGSFMGFTNPVTLSILNSPPGSIVTFVPAVVLPGGTSTLTVSNLNGLAGTFSPTVRGTSTTGNKDVVFNIQLSLTGPTQSPSLIAPSNNATNQLMTPLLEWNTVSGSTSYEYQVASDADFDNIVITGISNEDQYLITYGLNPLDQYYWRVRGINVCGTGVWSTVFNFTTSSCFQLLSNDVPKEISASGTPIVTSLFTTSIELEITDVNIVSLIGTHSWVDDLQFFLKAPSTTEVLFWDRPCNQNNANFNINFDDEANPGNHPCPPTNGGTYRPGSPLTPFDGQNSNGTWTLTIKDLFNQDGGSLSSWGLKVCGVSTCDLIVSVASGSGDGTLVAALACASPGDVIVISNALAGQTINIGSMPLAIDKNITIVSQSPDILITGSGTRVIEVKPGVQVKLEGMMIKAGTSMSGGAIQSEGNLTLKNVIIDKNQLISGASLVVNIDGILTLEGNCQINQ